MPHSYVERKARLAFLLLCSMLPGPAVAWGQVGLGLSPMRLEIAMGAGSVQAGVLKVSNESGEAVRFRAELLDFYIDDQDTPQFGSSFPAEADHSCKGWLTLNPMEAEVEGQGSVNVRYTLRVPANANPRSFHCAAGFTTLPAAAQLSGTGLKTAVRMVAAFYAVVGQPASQGELTKMSMEYVDSGTNPEWRAVVVVKNGGEKYFRASGDFAVLDEQGAVVETVPFPALPILPMRDQRFLFPLKNVADGRKYTLRARVDLGTPEIQEAVATVLASHAQK